MGKVWGTTTPDRWGTFRRNKAKLNTKSPSSRPKAGKGTRFAMTRADHDLFDRVTGGVVEKSGTPASPDRLGSHSRIFFAAGRGFDRSAELKEFKSADEIRVVDKGERRGTAKSGH